MARNGSGTYTLPAGNPVTTNTTISSTWSNNTLADIATALTQSVSQDGQTPVTANFPMLGFKHTGVGVASTLTDYARADQVQNSSIIYLTAVAGTNTITASLASPTLSAYAAGQVFNFVAAGANTGATTLNINSIGAKAVTKNGATALVTGDILSGATVQVLYDGTQFQITALGNRAASGANSDITSMSALTSIPSSPHVQDFRLTLTTATPVTTADVTGATTIYCTPYKGKSIALYDGSTRWNERQSAEFSLALGTLTSGKPYDVFCYDNATVPTLEFLVWTNDTTRATALVYQDGVLVKSGATTRRYMGTFYTTATTTTEDSVTKRFLWNYYNRVLKPMRRVEATATWTYTTASFRQANAAAANQLEAVIGVAEDVVDITVHGACSTSTTASTPYGVVGIGLDSTTVASGIRGSGGASGTTGMYGISTANYRDIPSAGRHFYAWLEYSIASGTTTWAGATGGIQTGIYGTILG